MQFFHLFQNFWIWLSWFSFGLNRIFQVHEMIINFFFFSRFVYSKQRCMQKMAFSVESIISNVGIVLEGLAFGSRLLVSFLSRGKIWLKSIPKKWAIFGQCALRHQSRWFQSVMILGLVFLVIEKVWQVWSCGKSWCIPNYQSLVSFKNSSFFLLLDFWRIREEVSKSRILWPIAWAGVIKRFIWFFKLMPLGAPRSLVQMVSKWKGSVYRDGFITNSNHQFFQDPKSNFWEM